MTKIMVRNFLLNISYNSITEEDFFNRSFLFDVYLLLTKNLNPLLIEDKSQDQTSQEMLYMFYECVPKAFFKHI